MNKFVTQYIFPLLILVFAVFSMAPSLYELSRAGNIQPDRHFELVHNYYTDYNFYLSRIREGIEGRWTVVEKYTSEPHGGSFIHEMYILMGQTARLSRVPPALAGDVYQVARVVLAITLLSLLAAFCKKSMQGWAIPAFLFAVTASSWPTVVAVVNTNVVAASLENIGMWRFGGYMSWWSVMDSLQRITFIPHLLAGQALLIFLVMTVTDRAVMKNQRAVVFLGLIAFILGMVLPPALVFLYGVMGIYWLLDGMKKSTALTFGAFVLVSCVSLFYLVLMTGIYPWKRLSELDIIHPLPFRYIEYFQAVGPILPLGILGLVWAILKKQTRLYPAVAWVIAWFVFLGVFHFVPQQSPLRFSEMAPHVALGVLTAYLCYCVYRLRYMKIAVTIATLALITLGVLQMVSSYQWQRDFVDHKVRASYPLVPTGSYVMYPLRDFTDAMQYLETWTPRSSVVVSETTTGNYIPVYSGNTVYVGHDNTINAEVKKQQVNLFFSGHMKPEEAKAWLASIPSKYVFFGPQEQADGGIEDLRVPYPFLQPFYKNAYVILYEVK